MVVQLQALLLTHHTVAVINIEHLLPKGYFLWAELESNDPAYIHGREMFNIDNGISFIEKTKDATILYIFGSTRSNYQINNFYIRNIDLFKRFILYFKDKGERLIKMAKNNKIILPEKQIIHKYFENNSLSERDRNKFIKSTAINKYYILNNGEHIQLTRREAESAVHMVNGYTAKEAAKILGLSYRTVEKFNIKVKEKLGYKTKQELETILMKMG